MTNYLFPEFQGWSWEKTKTPQWKTNIYEAESGIETRIQRWSYPRYKIKLSFNFLTDNNVQGVTLEKGDIEKLQGFFNSVAGTAEDFLFKDDVENHCEKQTIGVGNGTTKEFQLLRQLPNWIEPIRGIIEPPTIFVNGEEVTEFSCNSRGLVTFEEAPAPGSIISWSGTYYFRCRFDDDEIELTRTYEGLWESIEVNLITVKK